MELHIVDDIEAWLVAEIARRVGIEPREVDVRQRFDRLGLDSAAVTGLVASLAVALGRPLAPTLAWDHPTVEGMAAGLAGHAAAGPATAAPIASVAPLTAAAAEPIAVVGVACRLPGAQDAAGYWHLLRDGVDAITEVPADRWDVDALFDPDPAAPGKMSTRWGGFVDGVDRFDAAFFGISPREAAHMDPQQRLMLELSWSGLEDGGMDPAALRGSATGVFCGVLWSDYARLWGRDLEAIAQHTATGQDLSIVAARVAYTLGLQGPALGVSTACSSSLVAVHLACQSLRSGESTIALAGGVNLVLAPESTTAMTKFGAMAPDGRCKAFDAAADGYVRGEGGALVVLRPLSAALAAGDRVYCVIRGSAVNNDGISNGLTAPNPAAQEAVLRDACARSGVAPHEVQYVEAHGTGTLLGDPIEAGALGRVLGAGRPGDRPLLIGSVKTNIGHLEAAAGIAGLVKVALAMRHGVLPPSLHFHRPNPHIPFDDLRLRVAAEAQPWPEGGDGRLAGVSSFGFGGTNCHVVVAAPAGPPAVLFPLSAADAASLPGLARAAAGWVRRTPAASPADLASAAALHLVGGRHRAALVARSRGDLLAGLDALAAGGLAACGAADGAPAPVAFVCSGHGSQWAGMGQDLLAGEPEFRAAVERCDAILRRLAGWSPMEELAAPPEASRLGEIDVAQPVVFCLQVALAALWRSWGIEPDAVVGHSAGEVAAAHLAGILSLEDALLVVHHRSRLLRRLAGLGGMAVARLTPAAAEELVAPYAGALSVAGANAPATTILSGDPLALARCLVDLERRQIEARRVNVDVASHSAQCDPLLAELCAELRGIESMPARVPMVSTVSGAPVDGRGLGARYWARNLREPVRFVDAVERLLETGHATFVELSGHPILSLAVQETARCHGREAAALPSLERGEDGPATLLTTAAALYVRGRAPAWRRLYPADADPAPLPPALERDAAPPAGECVGARLLTLSAHSPEALRQLAGDTAAELTRRPLLSVDDLCDTAAARRGHHEHRLALAFETRADLEQALSAHAASRGGRAHTGSAARKPPGLAFVFPGEPGPAPGAVDALLGREPAFREALERCDRLVRGWTGRSLLDGSAPADGAALVAVQVATAALWRSWGVEPDAAVGQGRGEIAAAHVAGELRLEDALHLARRWDELGAGGPPPPSLPRDLDAARWRRAACGAAPDGEIDGLVAAGVRTFLEVGLASSPAGLLERCRERVGRDGLALPAPGAAGDVVRPLLAALGTLYTRGHPVDLRAAQPHRGRLVRLAPYPWQRERCWLDLPAAAGPAPADATPADTSPADTSPADTSPADTSPAGPAQTGGSLLERLAAAHPADRQRLLVDHVGRRVAHVMQVGSARPVDPDAGLVERGLDSLMAVELAAFLTEDLEGRVDLPDTLVFDYPTIADIAGLLAERLEMRAPEDGDDLEQLLAEIESLSEDEAEARLASAADGRG